MQLLEEPQVITVKHLKQIMLQQYKLDYLYIRGIRVGSVPKQKFIEMFTQVLRASQNIQRVILSHELNVEDINIIKNIFLSENHISEILINGLSPGCVTELMTAIEDSRCKIKLITIDQLTPDAIMALKPKSPAKNNYVLTLMNLSEDATASLMTVLEHEPCIYPFVTIAPTLPVNSVRIYAEALCTDKIKVKVVGIHYALPDQLQILSPALARLGEFNREFQITHLSAGSHQFLASLLTDEKSNLKSLCLYGSDDLTVTTVAKAITNPNCSLLQLSINKLSLEQVNNLKSALESSECCLAEFRFSSLDVPSRRSLVNSTILRKYFGKEYADKFIHHLDLQHQNTVFLIDGQQVNVSYDASCYPINDDICAEGFRLAFQKFISQEPHSSLTVSPTFKNRRIKFEYFFNDLSTLANKLNGQKISTSICKFYLGELHAKCVHTYNFDKNTSTFFNPAKKQMAIEIALRYYINSMYSQMPPVQNDGEANIAFNHNVNVFTALTDFFNKSPHANDVRTCWNSFNTDFKRVLKVKLTNLVNFVRAHPDIGGKLSDYLTTNPNNIWSICQQDVVANIPTGTSTTTVKPTVTP